MFKPEHKSASSNPIAYGNWPSSCNVVIPMVQNESKRLDSSQNSGNSSPFSAHQAESKKVGLEKVIFEFRE